MATKTFSGTYPGTVINYGIVDAYGTIAVTTNHGVGVALPGGGGVTNGASGAIGSWDAPAGASHRFDQ